MTKKTLSMIHAAYQDAAMRATDILDIVQNLYNILSEAEVCEEDSKEFDALIDGIHGCVQYRRKTFDLTNLIIDINFVIMYIVIWLNNERGCQIDIGLKSRRKSLESDLSKILEKSISDTTSAVIRDRFGLRGIFLNEVSQEQVKKNIYLLFDSISGILAGKNRKMKKDFVSWYEQNNNIDSVTKMRLSSILELPFIVDYVKDYIKNPKPNGYQSLHFMLCLQMYSPRLSGAQLEIQLRSMSMHDNATSGSASHEVYKEESIGEEVKSVFVLDDSTLQNIKIDGFYGYTRDHDIDGIRFSKFFNDRRISKNLVA